MNLFKGFSSEEKSRIRYIVSDVDDTITCDGLLHPDALNALYMIRERGLKTVLVTGGSAGWADGYIRQWPVDAVVAESGALLIYRKDGHIVYETNPSIDCDVYNHKRDELLRLTKDFVFSSDQYARLYDIAYEKTALDEEKERKLFDAIRALGGFALVSSIHVNVLFAPLNKKKGIDDFFPRLKDVLDIDMSIYEFYSHTLALGDSLNDEALFEAFPISVGNKRVYDEYGRFEHPPGYVTTLYGGDSFAKVIADLLV